MPKLPPQTSTDKGGVPFWHTHRASELLNKYITDKMEGTAMKAKLRQLWESREDYQEFLLAVFQKHVYQERTKQLVAPYWQHKRNKNARKKYEEVEEMLKEWKEA